MSDLPAPPPPAKARYKTRTMRGRPRTAILKAFWAGMAVMTGLILVGAHPLLAMGGLLGVIVWVILRASGGATFTITAEGLERSMVSQAGRPKVLRVAWDQIDAYSLTRDLKRSMREVAVLRIDLDRAPHRIEISDEADMAAFDAFTAAFEAGVHQHNATLEALALGATPISIPPRRSPDAAPQAIVRRQGFYQTLLAKVISLVAVAVSVAFVVLAVRGALGGTNLWRLLVVILPGTAYMVWRTFFDQRRRL